MELLEIPSLSGIAKNVGTSATSASHIALMICGAALAIGLVVVIYKLAHGDHGAREALLGWFVAVLVYGIAITYILNAR